MNATPKIPMMESYANGYRHVEACAGVESAERFAWPCPFVISAHSDPHELVVRHEGDGEAYTRPLTRPDLDGVCYQPPADGRAVVAGRFTGE